MYIWLGYQQRHGRFYAAFFVAVGDKKSNARAVKVLQ